MSDVTINQHYISQCILANFCNEKQQVCECLVNWHKIYTTNIEDSMMERKTYEHPYFEINRIEKWFSRIEDYIGPAIKQIITVIENHDIRKNEFELIRNLTNKYLPTFLIFYYRSGALLHEYSFGRENKNDRILLMTEKLMNSKYLRALSKSVIQNYSFAIIQSVHGRFLMSDQFLSTAALSIKNRFINITNRNMGLKDTIIFVPISKCYYAIYYHGDAPQYISPNRINTLNESQILDINAVIINNAYQKCVSFSKDAIQEVLDNFEYSSPSEILGGSDTGLSFGATLKKEVFFYNRDKKAWELITVFRKWDLYNNIGRNEACPCGSNKKYKKCCLDPFFIARGIIAPFAAKKAFPFASVNMLKDAVSVNATIEMPIEEFMNKKGIGAEGE